MRARSDADGASPLWTDPAPSTQHLRSLLAAGELSDARRHIDTLPDDLASIARDYLNRMQFEWSLTPEAMLAKLRNIIPDFSIEELSAYTKSGRLESTRIDGQVRYFRREPGNLIRFDRTLRHRVAAAAGKTPADDRHDELSPIIPHLADVVGRAEISRGRFVHPLTTTLDFRIRVKPGDARIRPGSTLGVTLPLPQTLAPQRDVQIIATSHPIEATTPHTHAHRALSMSFRVTDPATLPDFSVRLRFTTSAVIGWNQPAGGDPLDERPGPGDHDRSPRPPHLVFTPEVDAVLRATVHDTDSPRDKAYKLWRWVDEQIPWCAEHEYCLLPSLVDKALRTRRGDCGVAAMTYLALCRRAGIPARWESGLTLDPFTGGNLHDWCRIWLDHTGWIPVDPSYGRKQHHDPRVADFYFGSVDAYRLIINTDFGGDLSALHPAPRSEPLDFQRGEVRIDSENLYFDGWDYHFTFDHLPLSE
jgi:transglutaminase-like putative cysteine protease